MVSQPIPYSWKAFFENKESLNDNFRPNLNENIQLTPNNRFQVLDKYNQLLNWINKNCQELFLNKLTKNFLNKKANSGLQGVW